LRCSQLRNNRARLRILPGKRMEALMRKFALSIAAAAALLTASPAMAQSGIYPGPGGWGPAWWGYGYNAYGYPNGGGYGGGYGGGSYGQFGGTYTGAGNYDYYGGPYRGGQY
jgi:hypothetical protein